MNSCCYQNAWVGRCQKPTAQEFCEEHQDLVCVNCSAKATRQCQHTGGFVCGVPLCEACTHMPPDPKSRNIFGMGGGHASKELAAPAWEAYWNANP